MIRTCKPQRGTLVLLPGAHVKRFAEIAGGCCACFSGRVGLMIWIIMICGMRSKVRLFKMLKVCELINISKANMTLSRTSSVERPSAPQRLSNMLLTQQVMKPSKQRKKFTLRHTKPCVAKVRRVNLNPPARQTVSTHLKVCFCYPGIYFPFSYVVDWARWYRWPWSDIDFRM